MTRVGMRVWALTAGMATLVALSGCSAAVSAGCDWASPPLGADTAHPPVGSGDDLAAVLQGSWQLTQINAGAGWLPSDADVRYVFGSDSLLLCESDPQGAPDEFEGGYELDGTSLTLTISPYPLEAVSWDADRIVLRTGGGDNTELLLVRRD